MNRRQRRLRDIGAREWWLMARVCVVVSMLSVLIRLCGVPALLRLCALRAPRPPDDDARVVACVDRVLGRLPGLSRSPCLKRSLTLYRFLGATATDLQFCLGVRYAEPPHPGRRSRRLSGHAWLLRNGLPYLEANHRGVERFRVIYSYPTRERSVA
jgi:transglutaminase superfamily protein